MTKEINKLNANEIMQGYKDTLANLGKTLNVMAELLGALTANKDVTETESELESAQVKGTVPATIDARKLAGQTNNGSSGSNRMEEFTPDAMSHNRSSQYMGVTYAKGYKNIGRQNAALEMKNRTKNGSKAKLKLSALMKQRKRGGWRE